MGLYRSHTNQTSCNKDTAYSKHLITQGTHTVCVYLCELKMAVTSVGAIQLYLNPQHRVTIGNYTLA